MAGERFLFVNTDGFHEEDVASIQTSAGSGDADKLVKTSANGKLDASLLNFQTIKRYFTVDRASAAALPAVTYANGTGGVGATLTADANGALTIDGTAVSVSEVILIKNQASTLQNGIYTVTATGDGSNPFILTRNTEFDEAAEIEDGVCVAVGLGTANADTLWLQTAQVVTVGTDAITFISAGTNIIEAGDGLSKTGNRLDVELSANKGLKLVGSSPNKTLELDFFIPGSDTIATTDKAVDVTDLAANGTDQGANLIGADPANIPWSSATTVQGILEDLSDAIDAAQDYVTYTVGAGGITKGHLAYVSANNTVLPYSTITATQYGIGLAATTEIATADVNIISRDEVLTGVLSGATAGARQYWTGSGFSASIPAGGGSHIWSVGVAKNATDLHVNVEFIKKNA